MVNFLVQNIVGDGWAPEGNPIYKWAQYDKPPVPIGGTSSNTAKGNVSINMQDSHGSPGIHDRRPCEFTERVNVVRLPVFGRILFLKHTQGIIQASIVLFYWIYGSWSIMAMLLLPHYREDHISILPILCKSIQQKIWTQSIDFNFTI